MKTVLFVCTGNTCRSPMAEAIARRQIEAGEVKGLGEGGLDVFVASAGLQASDGVPTAPETLVALRKMGIEHDGRSKRLSPQMIRKADIIFCMTAGHQAAARSMVADSPSDFDKILTLDPEADLEDPIGMGQEAYDSLARQLSALIPARLVEALAPAPSPPAKTP